MSIAPISRRRSWIALARLEPSSKTPTWTGGPAACERAAKRPWYLWPAIRTSSDFAGAAPVSGRLDARMRPPLTTRTWSCVMRSTSLT